MTTRSAGGRAARVATDLSANWDFWPLLPLAEARRRLNLTPGLVASA